MWSAPLTISMFSEPPYQTHSWSAAPQDQSVTLSPHCRSSNSTSFAASVNTNSQVLSIQSAAHAESATTYMVVFQDAVSTAKIEQLCSTADSNYGFECAQTFSKAFKGFSVTVSASASCVCACAACVAFQCPVCACVRGPVSLLRPDWLLMSVCLPVASWLLQY